MGFGPSLYLGQSGKNKWGTQTSPPSGELRAPLSLTLSISLNGSFHFPFPNSPSSPCCWPSLPLLDPLPWSRMVETLSLWREHLRFRGCLDGFWLLHLIDFCNGFLSFPMEMVKLCEVDSDNFAAGMSLNLLLMNYRQWNGADRLFLHFVLLL